VAADGLGDLAEGHTLVADGVQRRAAGRGFDRQPGQAGGVGAVDGQPTVAPVTHVPGESPLARDVDEGGHEVVVAVAVEALGEAQQGRADAHAVQGQREQGGGVAANRRVGPGLGARHQPVVPSGYR
jgi:hypothetical protein